jgi:flagellar capping protein FliD
LQTAATNLVPSSRNDRHAKILGLQDFRGRRDDRFGHLLIERRGRHLQPRSDPVGQTAWPRSARPTATPFSGTNGTLPTGGTLTIRLDTQAGSLTPSKTTDVTIADGATPEAIRDAINKASAGVSAVVINGTAGKQLVLTGDTAGSNQFIKLSGVTGLAYDPNATPDPLTDAFQPVAGRTGLQPSSSTASPSTATTNTVTTAIDGITLNLLKGPEAPATSLSTTLTISKDNSAA